MLSPDDTIVAISSSVAPAARAIVRLSGRDAFATAKNVVTDLSREAVVGRHRLRWRDFEIPVSIYGFLAPRSATGEDVVEVYLPGNALIARSVVASLIAAGARQAEPGEFTARAYFHGRLDLAQAEGVAATIAAANEAELRAARQLLSGELARRLSPAMDAIAETLALVEAGIDFSDEDVSFLPADQLVARARAIDGDLARLVDDSRRFASLTHEPAVALVGRPNAGKSTLLNALCGRARAVVSPVAGTTRDLIWAHVPLRRGLIRLIDVAGLEPNVPPPEDESPAAHIAREMHARARRAAESADVLVLVHDSTDATPPPTLPRSPDLTVRTKCDLRSSIQHLSLSVSAVTGQGLDELRGRLDDLAFSGADAAANALALNDRHLSAVAEARLALGRLSEPPGSAEIVALELREALDALGGVLGQVTPDDVLGRVFGTFCIGK